MVAVSMVLVMVASIAGTALASPAIAVPRTTAPRTSATMSVAAWSWVSIDDEPGDSLNLGDQLFQQSAGQLIEAGGSPAAVGLTVRTSPSTLGLSFAPPAGSSLAVGTYSDAKFVTVGPLTHPYLYIGGDGRSCSTATGSFTVNDIAFSGGTLSRLDVSFVEYCDGSLGALYGQAQFNEPQSGPLVVQPSSLVFPPHYVGVANATTAVTVTNISAAPAPVAKATVGGAAAADVQIDGDTCPAVLGPGARCTVSITVTPSAGGTGQSEVAVSSGLANASVSVTDPGIGGYTAFVLDGLPSDPVSDGQMWDLNPFNSYFTATGTPAQITLEASGEGGQFEVILSAPSGQSLGVGDYPNIQNSPSATSADIQVVGSYSEFTYDCSGVLSGDLIIQQLAFDQDGNVSQFSADATLQCGGNEPTLWASLRLKSTVAYSAVTLQPAQTKWQPPLSYAGQVVGTASPTQPVVVTNAAVIPLAVAPALTGANAADFQISSTTCPAMSPLAPGQSCTTAVSFAPQVSGARTASLTFTTGTARGSYDVGLAGTGQLAPQFTYPVDQQLGVDTTQPFTWVTSGSSQANRLVVGTSPGDNDLFDSGVLAGPQTSVQVPALPTLTDSYARLYATASTEIGGTWVAQTVAFTVAPQVASFTAPMTGQFNADPTRPITWTANPEDQAYYLVVGTTPGSANLVNSGALPATQSSYAPPPMPAHTVLYATLFTEWVGSWNNSQSISFVYQSPEATFTSPVNGARVTDSAAPFTWSIGPQAQAYYLVVSTAHTTLINSGTLAPTRSSYPGVSLPAGVPIYATIFTKIGGSWSSHQTITVTAAAPATRAIATRAGRP